MISIILASAACAGSIETPWGSVSEKRAVQLCGSTYVFIGTIVESTPYTATGGFYSGHTHSTVRWSVERNLRNSPSPFIMEQPGGNIDGQIELLEGYPTPFVGRRYLMVVDRWPKDVPPAKKGDIWYKFSVELDPEAMLPSLANLNNALDTLCGDLD